MKALGSFLPVYVQISTMSDEGSSRGAVWLIRVKERESELRVRLESRSWHTLEFGAFIYLKEPTLITLQVSLTSQYISGTY